VCLIATSLGACGESGTQEIVAKVGEHPITKAKFTHWLSVHDPSGGTATSTLSAKQRVLETLISAEWTLAQASKLGVSVSESEAGDQLSLLEYARQTGIGSNQLLSNEAALKRLLSDRKLTRADRVWLVKLNLLTTKVEHREHLLAEQQVTPAQIAKYYEMHRQRFVMPEERDYVFIPTFTRANSQKARREIEAGDDFFAVQKRISIDPPELSGLRHLKRGEGIPVFTARVFRARPHVLLGPTPLGQIWDIYEVRKIRPRHQESLAEVEAAIRRRLANRETGRVPAKLADVLARAWKARTSCSAGYVVSLCAGSARAG
jgi:hypothetical protein